MFVPPGLNSKFIVQVISTKKIIRSKNLESKLTEFGIKFQITPGVVPNASDFQGGLLHSKFISDLICQRRMQIGEVGCALAHRNAITNLLKSDQEFGIIFEDDAEIIAEFKLDIIAKLLDSNAPIIIALGWIPGFAIAKSPKFTLGDEPVELITSPTCAFAYAINRPAAKVMFASQQKIIDVADWPIFLLNKINFFSIHPESPWVTANHDPEFSIIGKRSLSIGKSPIRVLLSRVRLIGSLLVLCLLSSLCKLEASPKQIVHRVLIRDMLYKYGNNYTFQHQTGNHVIPLPSISKWALNLLKVS